MSRAFTLIELAIVLAIIALLAGGVMVGKSVLRNSEILSIISQAQTFKIANTNFQNKYKATAGDMPNATSYWGKNATYCNGQPGDAMPNGTCNGDGDGIVFEAPAGNSTGEYFQYWHQLAIAGMIEGRYTGIAGPTPGVAGRYDSIPEVNIPGSRIFNAGWTVANPRSSGGSLFANNRNNAFYFGGLMTGSYAIGKVLKPSELYAIDNKIDDGLPVSGNLWVIWIDDCTEDQAGVKVYKLGENSLQCSLILYH
jgi:prepilin-type N-terminal cleavage/methylation domain-containing protein